MESKKLYLDLALVPPAVAILLAYHLFLWYKIKKTPLRTVTGVHGIGRRLWVESMMEDTDKKNILAVQTLRNMIMASTVVGTICILLTTGLAAVISSTYTAKWWPAETGSAMAMAVGMGAHNLRVLVAVKYVTPLLFLFSSFFCSTLSIRCLDQVNYFINMPLHEPTLITAGYVVQLLEKGCIFNSIATRLLYITCPLLLWILGPLLVLLSSVALVPVLYNLDFVFVTDKRGAAIGSENMAMDDLKSKDHYRII